MIAYAAQKAYEATAQSLIAKVNDAVIYPLITVGMGAAVVMFAWGVFKYVKGGDKGEADHKKGSTMIMWSIIGFLIMVSARAIFSLAAGTFGIELSN